MTDFQFGALGSIVYAGLTLGAGVATGVYNDPKKAKPVLIITQIANAGVIFGFGVSKSYGLDAALRFFIGFF